MLWINVIWSAIIQLIRAWHDAKSLARVLLCRSAMLCHAHFATKSLLDLLVYPSLSSSQAEFCPKVFLEGLLLASFSWSQADISFKPWNPRLVLQHWNWHHHPLFAACVWAQVGELNELRRLVRKEVHGDAVGASACTNPHDSPATDSRERMTLTIARPPRSFPSHSLDPSGERSTTILSFNLAVREAKKTCKFILQIFAAAVLGS